MTEYFNRQHLADAKTDSNLAARIKSFETAFGMQKRLRRRSIFRRNPMRR